MAVLSALLARVIIAERLTGADAQRLTCVSCYVGLCH